MNRQQALSTILSRLLIIFIVIMGFLIFLQRYGGDFRIVLYVFMAGSIGGYVGFHNNLKSLKDKEIIDLASSWSMMIAPSFISGILAFALYVLFSANIITGQLFPSFSRDCCKIAPQSVEVLRYFHATTAQDYWKLFFWSFVAGFNQKYVFNIIESIKNKA